MKRKIIFGAIVFLSLSFVACGSSESKKEAKPLQSEEYEQIKEQASKEAQDSANLDEIVLQVKNCIIEATLDEIDVKEGKYILKDGEVESNPEGGDDFVQLIEDEFYYCGTVSKADESKTRVQIEIKQSGSSYKVEAEFIE